MGRAARRVKEVGRGEVRKVVWERKAVSPKKSSHSLKEPKRVLSNDIYSGVACLDHA